MSEQATSREHDPLGRLLRSSGRGPAPSNEARTRVYAAVHERWRASMAAGAAQARATRRHGERRA